MFLPTFKVPPHPGLVVGFVAKTSDVSTAFMYAEVEEDACVLLPSNISYKGERVVCLLFKAMNGLRRAPLLWFYQLQRTVYSLGGEDTFESTLVSIVYQTRARFDFGVCG